MQYLERITTAMLKKTKILATIGPSTRNKDVLLAMVEQGLNAVRLNFSHDEKLVHKQTFDFIHEIERRLQQPIAIIQDLQGPKIRLGLCDFPNDSYKVQKGEIIKLVYGETQIDDALPVQFNIFPFIKRGDIILINDGFVHLQAEHVGEKHATCVVVAAGEIKSHKGVNLPQTILPDITFTQKDSQDLLFGMEQGIDYVALSFVQNAKDILHVRDFIHKHKKQVKIIAKIETAAAVQNIEEIIAVSDAVMVARGDLAIEISQEDVPLIQRKIITLARKQKIPVIVATQMLESMIHSTTPTRAEVNDVASAVLDQADVLMLSAETAIGDHPVEVISTMKKIIQRTEQFQKETATDFVLHSDNKSTSQTPAVAAAGALLAKQLQAKMIFVLTSSGNTAVQVASFRPITPILAVTDNIYAYKQLCLLWGIYPYYISKITNNQKVYTTVISEMKTHGDMKSGDIILLIVGTHPGQSGHTNSITVQPII